MEALTHQKSGLPDSEAYWALLERVANSEQLRRAPRLREVLFYVGRRSLKEGCDQVREHEIGCDVFGRPETYDTGVDNVVRTSVSELRKRIEAYFDAEGMAETVILEIPRGSYVPVFRSRPVAAQDLAGPTITVVSPTSNAFRTVQEAPRTFNQHRFILAGLIVLVLAITSCTVLWIQNRSAKRALDALNHSLYPYKSQPSLAQLWSGFLDANQTTDVVMADTSFLLLQIFNKQSFSFNDYLSRSYVGQSQTQDSSLELHAVMSKIADTNLASADDFRLAQHILALNPLGKNVHLYNAREYVPALINQDNVILLGSRIANPWDELFESQLNFVVTSDKEGFATVSNRAPTAGEQKVYIPTTSMGYCVVAYLPNPGQTGKVLLLEGTSAEAVEASGDFLFSEDQLSKFLKLQHVTRFPYFEVLLRTSQVRSTPLTATVLAYRTYPNLR
jgi:hypothetical protein